MWLIASRPICAFPNHLAITLRAKAIRRTVVGFASDSGMTGALFPPTNRAKKRVNSILEPLEVSKCREETVPKCVRPPTNSASKWRRCGTTLSNSARSADDWPAMPYMKQTKLRESTIDRDERAPLSLSGRSKNSCGLIRSARSASRLWPDSCSQDCSCDGELCRGDGVWSLFRPTNFDWRLQWPKKTPDPFARGYVSRCTSQSPNRGESCPSVNSKRTIRG